MPKPKSAAALKCSASDRSASEHNQKPLVEGLLIVFTSAESRESGSSTQWESGIEGNQRPFQHQTGDAAGQQIARGAREHRCVRDPNHPLVAAALALGGSRAGKQANGLTLLIDWIKGTQLGEVTERAGIKLHHLVDQHVYAFRQHPWSQRLGGYWHMAVGWVMPVRIATSWN